YKLFIVVESVADAYRLARELPDIKSINLGGTKVREGSQNIAKAINLLADEMTQLRELAAGGVEIEIRLVPNDRKQLFA
ncbi:PTS mannose/fructose/sorbose transporter subunit IIB, partial [Salmonella enterica]|nr:PTS mannose/fructose/sorbose transporter subunit IIB [Salmonella enterica]